MTSERGKDSNLDAHGDNIGGIDINDAINLQQSQSQSPESNPIQVINEYQQFLRDTSWYQHAGESNAPEFTYLSMGLAGESGEFLDEVKKIVRQCGQRDDDEFHRLYAHPEHHPKLLKELGDVVWYLMQLLDFMEVDLILIMVINTYKLYRRLHKMPEFKDLEWPFTSPKYSWKRVNDLYQDIGD